jgi:hypothetical protein
VTESYARVPAAVIYMANADKIGLLGPDAMDVVIVSKKFALALFATSMLTGSTHAMTLRSSSLSHAHFSTCSEGLVKTICVCRAETCHSPNGKAAP